MVPQLPPYKTTFSFNGSHYSGYIVSSTDMEPNFHWFLFDDVQLISTVADGIAFKVNDGELKPVHHYTKHPELVDAVKLVTLEYLAAAGISLK